MELFSIPSYILLSFCLKYIQFTKIAALVQGTIRNRILIFG